MIGVPCGSDGKNPPAMREAWVWPLGQKGHGDPLQYSSLGNPQGQRSLEGYSPWGHKESDITEWLSTAQHVIVACLIKKYFFDWQNHFIFSPAMWNDPASLNPHQYFVISLFIILAILIILSHCGFNLPPLMINVVEHIFMGLFAICISSLLKYFFMSFTHFVIGLFVFAIEFLIYSMN